MPCSTEPLEVSDRMSERLGIPSTKYGPSVCCGVPCNLTEVGVSEHVPVVEAFFWLAESSGGMPNCVGIIDKVWFSIGVRACPKDFDRLSNDICVKNSPREIIVRVNIVKIRLGFNCL